MGYAGTMGYAGDNGAAGTKGAKTNAGAGASAPTGSLFERLISFHGRHRSLNQELLYVWTE
jgi:hypothetical protein